MRIGASVFILAAFSVVTASCAPESPVPESEDAVAAERTPSEVTGSGAVRVYTSGDVSALRELLRAYRAETGHRYHVVNDAATAAVDLLGRPASLPDADLYITGNFAEIWAIAEADKLRPTYSAHIDASLPESLRDPESRWSILSVSARVLAFNRAAVSDDELSGVQNYAALGDEIWKDRLCVSSSRLGQNRTLVAKLIQRHGVRDAEIIVRQWRLNFGQSIYVDDAALIAAVEKGQCDIGLVDSGSMAAIDQNANLAIHWLDDPAVVAYDAQAAGVSRHAVNSAAAVRLLEWLVSPDANALYAFETSVYPANPEATLVPSFQDHATLIRGAGRFRDLGYLQEDAAKLVERARYR